MDGQIGWPGDTQHNFPHLKTDLHPFFSPLNSFLDLFLQGFEFGVVYRTLTMFTILIFQLHFVYMLLKLEARERKVVLFGLQSIFIVHLLANIYLYSPNQRSLALPWLSMAGMDWQNGWNCTCLILSWSWMRQCPAFQCQLPVHKYNFQGWLNAMFFSFLCFFLVISLFTMALEHNVEMLSTLPKDTNTVSCFMEKLWPAITFVQAWAIVLLSKGSMLMNQHCKLSTVLSRNTHKTMLCIAQLKKK
jgi:hypothetical protein